MADKSLELALRIVAEATGKQNLVELVDELRNIEQSADAANPAADKLSGSLDQTDNSAKKASQTAGKLANELNGLANQADLIRAFEQSKQKLEQQEIATAAAAQALDQLQTEAKNTDAPFVQLARSLEAAENDLAQMRAELTQQTAKHQQLQTALKQSHIDTHNLTAKKRELAAGFDKAGRSVDQFSADLRQGTAAQKAQAQSLDGVIGKVTALVTAYVGLDRVGQAVSEVFSTGDKFEKLAIQMQAMMGSIAGGEKATAWVQSFTKNTPLQLGEVSQAFVKLKAFGIDPMNGSLQAITDQALKLGGGYQEVEGMALALGQAWAKQKLQGEEILQLVERGVPVWDLLQKTTGKNVEELNKLSSAGKLGRDVIKGLIDEMGRTSAGSAAAQMALFSGQVSNAKDNMEQFYNLVAQSGAMDWLKGQLTELNKQFADMTKDGSLKEWAQSVSDTIINTGNAIKSAITTLYEFREEIATVAKVWLALKVGNFFTSMISGATAAIASMRTYNATIVASGQATQAATIAANKWGAALKAVGKAGLYTWLISELIEVGGLYKELLTAENTLQKSQQKSEIQAKLLADQFAQLSKETGLHITSMAELDALVAAGKLVWDERSLAYASAAKAQANLTESNKLAAIEDEKRQAIIARNIELYGEEIAAYMDVDAQLKQLNDSQAQATQVRELSIVESLKLIETLERQAQNLEGVRGGVDGFILSIDSAKAAMQGAGAEYSQQIVILDELKAKFESHNDSLKRQAFLAGDVSKAYAELGLTAGKALDETALKMQGAFELIQQSNEPLALQQQAYLKWAEAAIKAADATNSTVPASVKAAAAALGLTQELDKLITKANALKPVTDTNSDAVNRFKTALDKTSDAIAINQQILKSATATAEQKAQAQQALVVQQARLTEQTNALNQVQKLELASLAQLQREKARITEQMAQLNTQYQLGQLTALEYNDKQKAMADILAVVNNLLGDFKNAQDQATASTKAGTRATADSVAASQSSVKSLREQKEALETVARSAQNAARQVNVYNAASVKDVVDYQEKNQSAFNLSTKAIEEEKERREYETAQAQTFERLSNAIKNATSANALSALFNQINKQLIQVSLEQKKQLNEALNAQQAALKSQTQSNTRSYQIVQTGAYNTAPFNSYQPTVSGVTSKDQSALIAAINSLVSTLKTQASPSSTKTVRLELVLPGGVIGHANLAEFQEQFLQHLEQLRAAQ